MVNIIMSKRITQNEISALENDVLRVMKRMEPMKFKMSTENFRIITQHLQYTLTTLRNMSTEAQLISSNPYSGMGPSQTIRYNPDGSTRVVSSRSFHSTGDGWEKQFQEGLLNPPSYMQPPHQQSGGKPRRYR
jgi:ABC-type glutathione transport system ATPase component